MYWSRGAAPCGEPQRRAKHGRRAQTSSQAKTTLLGLPNVLVVVVMPFYYHGLVSSLHWPIYIYVYTRKIMERSSYSQG